MKTLSRSLLAGLAAALLLSGCSDDATPPEATPTQTPSPSASTTNDPPESASPSPSSVATPTITADPETGQFDWCDPAEQAPFTGEAADKFGADKVMDAYCTMVELQMTHSFVDSLLRAKGGFTTQDFEPMRAYLGQDTRADWDADVAKIVKGTADDQSSSDVAGLMAFDLVGGSGYVLDTPAVYNQRFTPAQAWVDTKAGGLDRLVLKFTVSADYAIVREKDDKPMAYSVDKNMTYYLVPGTGNGKSWYIDGYTFEKDIVAPVARDKIIKPTS